MGTNEASRSYGVPKSTLLRHMTGKNKVDTGEVKFYGHASALPDYVEEELVEHV